MACNNSQMNQDLSIVSLVLHASFVVQIVMAGLVLVVADELDRHLRQALRLARAQPQRGVRARVLVRPQPDRDEPGRRPPTPDRHRAHGRIFASGMREFLKLREKRLDAGASSTARAAPCAPASSASWT